jgi:hypothetical protein
MQFYTNPRAFQAEVDLYNKPTLQKLMPKRHEVFGNEDGSCKSPSGFVFPPFIVLERGESLDEFARHMEHEFITVCPSLFASCTLRRLQ